MTTLAAIRRMDLADLGWKSLGRELDAWAAAGRNATFWWRDDDAVEDTPALRRLLAAAQAHGVPVALAVIPAKAKASLFDLLTGRGDVAVLQHGYAHANHAPAEAKKRELGDERPLQAVLDDIGKGRDLMPASALPVLVPPWNRIGEAVIGALPGLGIRGLSASKPRAARRDAAGLVHANIHVDPLRWPGGPRFIGEDAALKAAVRHLKARRQGTADAGEPTGLLTHHLVQDDACWAFVDRFLSETLRHRAARWLAADQVFASAP